MDYYKVLGVTNSATYNDIKRKYKDLAIKYHPDKNPRGAERFKLATEAYKTLSDPYKRGKYDALREQHDYHNIDRMFGMSMMNAMDIFNNMFGRNFHMPIIDPINIPKNTKSYSYSSSTVSSRGSDGKIRTKEHRQVNRNGKKDEYYQEYYIKDGKKYIIKRKGDPKLLGYHARTHTRDRHHHHAHSRNNPHTKQYKLTR